MIWSMDFGVFREDFLLKEEIKSSAVLSGVEMMKFLDAACCNIISWMIDDGIK